MVGISQIGMCIATSDWVKVTWEMLGIYLQEQAEYVFELNPLPKFPSLLPISSQKSLSYNHLCASTHQSYPLRLESVPEAKEQTGSFEKLSAAIWSTEEYEKTSTQRLSQELLALFCFGVFGCSLISRKKRKEKWLNTTTWRPKMATQSSEDMRRWQPRRPEHTGLFLISINPA